MLVCLLSNAVNRGLCIGHKKRIKQNKTESKRKTKQQSIFCKTTLEKVFIFYSSLTGTEMNLGKKTEIRKNKTNLIL